MTSEFITFFTLDSQHEEFCQKDSFLTVRKNKTFPLDANDREKFPSNRFINNFFCKNNVFTKYFHEKFNTDKS